MGQKIRATASIPEKDLYSLDIQPQIVRLQSGHSDATLLATIMEKLQSSINRIETAVRESIGQRVPNGAIEGSILVNFQKRAVWQEQPSPEEIRESVRSRPYPWGPKHAQPDVADPMFDETDWGFGIAQLTKPAADGAGIVELAVNGKWIVNEFSDVAAPAVGKYGSTAASGGTIPGAQTYYVKVCAVDSAGLLSEPSEFSITAVSAVGNTNTITIAIAQWQSGTVGYKVFAGQTEFRLTFQAEGSGTPATITLTSYKICDAGIPDKEFRRLHFNQKRVFHSGVFGATVTGVGAGEIAVTGAGWTTNQWAGYRGSIIGIDVAGYVQLWDFLISANTTDTLTMTPDPQALGILQGDVFVMRSRSTVGVDGSGNYLQDANWQNSRENGGRGLIVNGERGRIIRFLSGPGRGYEYRIKSNTATRIYIDGDWLETPTADSVFVICEVLWQTAHKCEDIRNSEFGTELAVSFIISNEDRLPRLVQALTINQDGTESLDYWSPVREIFVFGEPGEGAYEPAGFNLGSCNDLAVNDVSDGFAEVLTDGTMLIWGIVAKTQSSSGRVVVDIERSRDGAATWNSIFNAGNDNKLVLDVGGVRHYLVRRFHPIYGEVLSGDLLRAKVLEAGTGVRYVNVKGIWRRPGFERGTLDFSFEGNALLAA